MCLNRCSQLDKTNNNKVKHSFKAKNLSKCQLKNKMKTMMMTDLSMELITLYNTLICQCRLKLRNFLSIFRGLSHRRLIWILDLSLLFLSLYLLLVKQTVCSRCQSLMDSVKTQVSMFSTNLASTPKTKPYSNSNTSNPKTWSAPPPQTSTPSKTPTKNPKKSPAGSTQSKTSTRPALLLR